MLFVVPPRDCNHSSAREIWKYSKKNLCLGVRISLFSERLVAVGGSGSGSGSSY